MDPNQVLLAITGLFASLLGASIAFWAQAWHWHQSRKSRATDDEAAAIQTILVKSLSMDLHAHQLALAAKNRSSLDGTIHALFGSEGPIHTQATLEAMTRDVEELHAAVTHIWLTSDGPTIALANAVAEAAAEVISAHHDRYPRPRFIAWLLDLIWGVRLGNPRRIEGARVRLAGEREQLVRLSRRRWNLPELAPGRQDQTTSGRPAS